MKFVSWLGAVVMLAGASYALAYLHPFGDPRQGQASSRGALPTEANLPEGARSILTAKCADCHSEATSWPFYAHLAPASWLIERDVTEGRAHLNLSQWGEISQDRRDTLAQEIAHEAREGSMPPFQYRLVHWGAGLTPAEVKVLGALAPDGHDPGAAIGAGNAERGKAVFEKRCTGCHAIDRDRDGPHLRGVYGRKAGSVPGFDYSQALRKSGLIWGEQSLENWLKDTDAAVPGNAMGFAVPKAQERADIIAFLKSIR